MVKINNDRLGNLTKDDINFPKHLTPEIVHTALYIHNAPSKEDVIKRSEYMAKQIGILFKVVDKLEQRIATLEKVLDSHAKCIGELRGTELRIHDLKDKNE